MLTIHAGKPPRAPFRVYYWGGAASREYQKFGIRYPWDDFRTLREAREAAAADAEACQIVNLDSGEIIENLCVVTTDEGRVDLRIGV